MDAFEAAFRLPNILRRLFAEGAFSQAFVPIFAEYRRQRGDDRNEGARRARRDAARGRAARRLDHRRARGAVARLPAGVGVQGHAGQGRPHRADDPDRLPVHLLRFARVARGRRAQRLPPLRDPGVHAGAAQPVDHRRRDVPRAVLRSADHGARLGRADRRRRAARCCRFARSSRSACFRGRASTGATRACGACCWRWVRRSSACPRRRSRR